jgi:hypothetical protein
MGAVVTSLYLDADGTGQLVVENSNDAVTSGVFCVVRPKDFLAELARMELPAASAGPDPSGLARGVVTEQMAATLSLETVGATGARRQWLGSTKALPPEIVRIEKKARELLAAGERRAPAVSDRYIRASLLTPDEVVFMKEGGSIQDAAWGDIEKSPALSQAISHPGQLVPLPAAGADPYAPVGTTFRHLRSVELTVKGHDYQIRNLVATPRSTSKEKGK